MRSLIPIILIAVSLGLFYVHIDPRYQEVKALQAQQSQYKEALVKSIELKVVAQELLTKYNAIPQENIAKLERLVPDNLNTVKLVTDLDSIGGKHGITISSVNVTEEQVDEAQEVTEGAPKPYRTTTISFTFSSNYKNLLLFLRDVEKSLQVVDVKDVAFNSEAGESGDVYDYSMSIDAYWLK